MKYPEEYIKTYYFLPLKKIEYSELEREMMPDFYLVETHPRRYPESIQEFHIGDTNGMVSASKFQEILYDRKGRQTARFSFGRHESAVLEELWRFNQDDCLTEYFRRYIKGETEFTTFKYNKDNKIEKIIEFYLDEYGSRINYLFDYDSKGLLNTINCYDFDRTLMESTRFCYDSNLKLTSKETYNESKKLTEVIEFNYNSIGQLSTELSKNQEGQQKYQYNYAYDYDGRLVEKSRVLNNKSEITNYVYENQHLVGKSQKYITENGVEKSNEWLADTKDFIIIEKTIQQNLQIEKVTEYDESWFPKKGIVKTISKNEECYELQFRVSVHD